MSVVVDDGGVGKVERIGVGGVLFAISATGVRLRSLRTLVDDVLKRESSICGFLGVVGTAASGANGG